MIHITFLQNNACTSTAAAILLRYYNMTKSEYGGVTKDLNDSNLRNALLDLMGTTVRIEKYMLSMDIWFSNINYTVSTYAWTTSYDYQNTSYSNIKFVSRTRKTDYFSTYKGLIDVSSPVILMVGKNMLSYLSGSQLHSVVGYGYSNYDGGYYAIVADPNDKSINKIVSWDALHTNGGRFGLYAMIRTTIKKS